MRQIESEHGSTSIGASNGCSILNSEVEGKKHFLNKWGFSQVTPLERVRQVSRFGYPACSIGGYSEKMLMSGE